VIVEQNDERAMSQADLFEWPHQFVTATWHRLPLTNRAYTTKINDALMDALQQLPWTYRFAMSTVATAPVGSGI
jgi:hypothetical protein